MQKPPRPSTENLVVNWMKIVILIVSSVGGAIALTLFIIFYKTTGDLILAQSIAFATLGTNSLIYVFSVKTLKESFWTENIFSNRWLNIAVLAGFALQILPFQFAISREFLGLHPLNLNHWIMIITASFFMFVVIEVLKLIFRIHIFERSHKPAIS